MNRSVLTGTILGAFAIVASASLLASPRATVPTDPKAANPSPASPVIVAVATPAKPGAGAVVDAGRAPVPIVRPPKEESSTSAASIAEPSTPPAPPPAPPQVGRETYATAWPNGWAEWPPRMPPPPPGFGPRGEDQRYWVVPMGGQRVLVFAWDRERKAEKRQKHRRRGDD